MDNSDTSGQNPLTIIIRSPNRACGDQVVDEIDLNWTIKDLKSRLSAVYPTNPPEKDQRLIYSGKLLLDHLRITDVFKKVDTTPIVHLVCTFRPQTGSQQGAQFTVAAAEQHGLGPSTMVGTHPTQPAAMTPSSPSADGLRNRVQSSGLVADTTQTAGSAPSVSRPMFPTYSLYSPQQLLWLQQLYAQQYYMQYQAALAAAASSSTSVALASSQSLPANPQPAAAAAAAPHAALPNQPANQNVPEPRFLNPGGANPNLRMNAQGGPVMEEEEDVERDWLDWVYTASRLSVFLSIVYFYSNISRFVLVMSSLLLMYLHTAGWFAFRRRPIVAAPRDQAPDAAQNQQEEERGEDPDLVTAPAAEADAVEDGTETGPSETLPPAEPQRPSVTQTAWVFFKAFFASLVPEVPQGLVN